MVLVVQNVGIPLCRLLYCSFYFRFKKTFKDINPNNLKLFNFPTLFTSNNHPAAKKPLTIELPGDGGGFGAGRSAPRHLVKPGSRKREEDGKEGFSFRRKKKDDKDDKGG